MMDQLETDVRALCSPERAWAEPHVAEVVLPGEDPVAFVVTRVRLETELEPTSDFEREAIVTIVAARWRRWRIEGIYRGLHLAAAGPDDGPVHDRERRARMAACRMERTAELRIEQSAAAEIRRRRKDALAELKGHIVPVAKERRKWDEEQGYQLERARREVLEARERADAAEARLAAHGAAPLPASPPDDHDALHPNEENMKHWTVVLGDATPAAAAATARQPSAAATAARLARKLAGRAVENDEVGGAG